MKVPAFVTDAIIRRAKRTPYFHLPEYMGRWWLFRFWPRGKEGQPSHLGARIHNIIRSDDDRAFHCHPWPYITILLRGGYTELREFEVESPDYSVDAYSWAEKVCVAAEKRGEQIHRVFNRSYGDKRYIIIHTVKKHDAGTILFRRSTDRHRLVLSGDTRKHGGVWSLFITFKKQKSWFFYTEEGPVNWRDYPPAIEDNITKQKKEWVA